MKCRRRKWGKSWKLKAIRRRHQWRRKSGVMSAETINGESWRGNRIMWRRKA
jgi:hypothetical protein